MSICHLKQIELNLTLDNHIYPLPPFHLDLRPAPKSLVVQRTIKSLVVKAVNPGKQYKGPVTGNPAPDGLVGFSSKITDPAFTKYQKDSRRWSFLFSSVLAVIAIIAFPIYGNITKEIDWPGSLFYGIGIGAMFIAIASLQTLKRQLDKTWDGVVIDKQSSLKRERTRKGRMISRTEYIIKIKKDSGGVKTNKWIDSPALFNYYSVGDRVRHHKGFQYYEKYDKSIDLQILCAACNSFNDIAQDTCIRCKCPLLK